MEIVSYHKEKSEDELLPYPLRFLIIGASGSGKTNLLMNLIYNEAGISFKKLYVLSKSIQQPIYVKLREYYKNVEKKLKNTKAYFFDDCDDLPSLDECYPNSLIVFDDCLLGKQDKIKDYFIRGRHKNLSCVYLSQSYGKVDRQVIRNNVNFICIFKQNNHYAKSIYNDFVGSDMSFGQFMQICTLCWDEPYGFLSINMTKKPHQGKYMFKLEDEIMT